MSDFGRLTEGNWYALGSLVIQLGFLVAAAWFGRGLLRTARRFQEQLGALLKLNITAGADQQSSSAAKHPLNEASPYWLMPSEPQTSSAPVLTDPGPGHLATAWHGFVHWLNAPITHAEVSPWRRMMNWLQAPAGT